MASTCFLTRSTFFVAILAALSLAGCAGSGSSSGEAKSGRSLFETIISGTAQDPEQIEQGSLTNRAPLLCPSVDIQSGTKVLRTYERDREGDPGFLRYQAIIAEVARECSLSGTNLVMKIGAAGRALTGPKGVAETISLPIRFAVIRADGTVIFSELVTSSVTFASSTASQTFSSVVETSPFSLERGEKVRVLIGFDQQNGR